MKEQEAKKREEEKKTEQKELNQEWPQDAQDELQDFIESQGIYIRQ